MRLRSATSGTSTEYASSCEECCFPEITCNTTSTKHKEAQQPPAESEVYFRSGYTLHFLISCSDILWIKHICPNLYYFIYPKRHNQDVYIYPAYVSAFLMHLSGMAAQVGYRPHKYLIQQVSASAMPPQLQVRCPPVYQS